MRPGGISAEGGSAADFAAVKAIASVMSTRSATSEGGGRISGSRGGGRSKKGLRDVVFTPLYGCDENGHGVGPVCSLLEVGGVTIMLDCGWDIYFDTALLEPLRAVVKRIDLVLISHPDLEHLGALPYAFGKLGMRARVYATLPVWKMGQMTVYDAFLSRTHEGDFDAFDLDDVDTAFGRFKTLKYSQHLTFSGRGAGVTITPYAAGRMIGAAVWRVSWQTEDNDIVYATAYNHKPERHLRPSALSVLTRPNVLITDAHNAMMEVDSRKAREAKLITTIMDTVRGGGNVLLPTDTAGRVLELLVLLDEHWRKHRLGSYKLVLLHNTAFNTAEFAKSQLEWMSNDIGRAFDLQRSNPFELRSVHVIHTLEELDELGEDPRVVLATDMSLDYGFSKALLLRWASGTLNTILLTGRGHGASTARELLRYKKRKEDGDVDDETPLTVSVRVPVRVPLAGEELRAFRDEENRKRRLEAEAEEARRQAAAMEKEQVIADSDDEGEGGENAEASATAATTATTATTAASSEPKRKKRRAIVASLFSKYSKPQQLMFGYHDPEVPMDDYGVKETEPIGWLAAAMQQHNSEMPAAMEEEGVTRGKLKIKDGKFVLDRSESKGDVTNNTTNNEEKDKAEQGRNDEGVLQERQNNSKERSSAGHQNKKPSSSGSAKGDAVEDDDSAGRTEGDKGADGEEGEDEEGDEDEEDGDSEDGDDESNEGPVDPLRMGGGGGKESAFFQDSGAVPTKLENEEQEIEIRCRIEYVDSEGLADGRSIKNTVVNLAPKMLVVVGGTRRAKRSLVGYLKRDSDDSSSTKTTAGAAAAASAAGTKKLAGGDDQTAEPPKYVMVDKALEPLQVGLDSGAFDVLLHDSLHTQLKWKQLKNYGVAHMECRVDPRSTAGKPPLLCSKPRADRVGHPAMFLSVGNVNIMQLQKALVKAGVRVEFAAGTLRCEGVVTVRSGDGGKMDLEGPIGDAYFRVRDIVYKQYTII